MTEAEWLSCTHPVPMLRHLDPHRTDRKLRLFLVACGRRLFPLLPLSANRRAIEITDEFLDGRATEQELSDAAIECETTVYEFGLPDHPLPVSKVIDEVGRLPREELEQMAGWGAMPLPNTVIRLLEEATYFTHYLISVDRISPYPAALFGQVRFLSVPMLRDIFGNPFRPVAVDPRWRTSTVLALADGIYADRAFDRLPILADALEEAGCDNADVLAHCRGDGPHVRGCWVVDLLLGKE